jgi:virginiamycin B lyase
MINPMTHAIAEFPLPMAGCANITAGPDGNLWFTDGNTPKQIGMINPTTHAIAYFPLPTVGSAAAGMTAGPDGNLWFTDAGTGQIGMINPTTDAIAEFPVPIPTGAPPAALSVITTGPDGDLWFAIGDADAQIGGEIGVINPTTHSIAEVHIRSKYAPGDITDGPDGKLWFTDGSANKIGMINPKTRAVALFSLPKTTRFPIGITTGPNGNLWFTDEGSIGEFRIAASGRKRGRERIQEGDIVYHRFRSAVERGLDQRLMRGQRGHS